MSERKSSIPGKKEVEETLIYKEHHLFYVLYK